MAFNIVAGVNNALYGSVSGSGSYEEGVEVTLEVTVNDGYRFVEWSDGNTDNPRTFNATEDVTLTATLEAIPEYAVTLNTNNSNLGTTSGSGNYREGSPATISATPSLHCRFVKWDDDNTDNPRSITVNSAVTLEAIFETVNWYSITTSVNDATMGSVTGAGDYDEGTTVTLTASPNTDCKFVEWSDGNTDNPRTFTAAASWNYEATFAAIMYANVTIESNDNELGSVSGATSGNIEVGTEITLTATPETDCRFVGWEIDGVAYSSNDTLVYEITDDVTITAVFEAITFYQVNLITSDSEYGSINVVSASETARGENNNIYPEFTEIALSAVPTASGKFLNWGDGDSDTSKTIVVDSNMTIRANFYPATGLLLVAAHKIQKIWTSIKSFFSAPTGASKIGVASNNALGATTLADVVNSVGQANGLAQLNANGKLNGADIEGSLNIDITGNAATATTATKVGIATVGSSTEPVYINAGTPTACGSSLDVDITGNAATATDLNKQALDYPKGEILSLSAKGLTTAGIALANGVIDSSGKGNHGQAYDGVSVVQDSKMGDCFSFDGTDDYIDLTKADFFNSLNGISGLTISAKIKPTTFSNNVSNIIEAFISGSTTLFTARISSENKFTAGGRRTSDDSFYKIDSNLILEPNKTVTLTTVFDYENAKIKLFINGEKDIEDTFQTAGVLSVVPTACYISKYNDSSRFFDGLISDLHIYPRALSAKEIKSLYMLGNIDTSFAGKAVVAESAASAASATTATKATQDGSGNTITSTYATIAKTYDDTTNTSYRGMRGLDGSTSGWVRTTSSGIIPSQSGAAGSGHCGLGTSSWYFATAYIDNIYGKLNGNCTGSSASCTGNAATATSATSATTATNANNAKLTHTVGNTEYPLVFGTSFVITDAQQALRIGTPTATAANCALRCKSYCAAANTQGEAYLVCGNNLAKASANNARGSIYLYGTSTAHTQIVPGNNSTSNVVITLPASTGTLALTSSNITGSSASCTGNAATATTASACSGNAASSTYTSNIRVTQSSVSSWYNLVYTSGIAANTNYSPLVNTNSALRFYGTANPSSASSTTKTYAYLGLGNATACSNVAGRIGCLRMYGQSTGYTDVVPGYASTSGITLTLPSSTGTIALTSQIISSVFSIAKSTAKDGTLGDTSANWWYTCNKFSNGVIMMYGFVKCTASSQTKTITFPSDCAPASNNYVAIAIPQRSGAAFTWCSIGTKSTTSFNIQSNSYNANNWCTGYFYIVIG